MKSVIIYPHVRKFKFRSTSVIRMGYRTLNQLIEKLTLLKVTHFSITRWGDDEKKTRTMYPISQIKDHIKDW